jgi:DNA (cytosine-5)-methyltransferase 1
MIKYLDMFCGISAFRSAAEMIGGFECVGYCDNDPTAIAAYRSLYNTDKEVFYDDARTIDTDTVPDIGLLVGGFPCVAFSQAGRRLGFEDERGTLFFELARILEAKHPAFFCFENVPALLTHDGSRSYSVILEKISELGYICEWFCVDGSNYLPQSRKRVFIVGYLAPECCGQIFPLDVTSKKAVSELSDHQPQGNRVYDANQAACTLTAGGGGFAGKCGMYFVDMNEDSKLTDIARCITTRQDSGISKHKGEHSAVLLEFDGTYPIINPDREKVRQQGRRIRENGAPAFCLTLVDRHGIIHNGWIRKLVPQECFRLMGFSDEQFQKVAALGFSDAKLYKLAGNSIMIPILVDILQKIKDVGTQLSLFDTIDLMKNEKLV